VGDDDVEDQLWIGTVVWCASLYLVIRYPAEEPVCNEVVSAVIAQAPLLVPQPVLPLLLGLADASGDGHARGLEATDLGT
jgi:hypothetical protein